MRLFVLVLCAAALPAAEFPQFRAITVTDSLKMGYQLVAADLNRDGRPDLIAVDERGTELAWFENPSWQRHVIITNVPRTINLDVYDYRRRRHPRDRHGPQLRDRPGEEHRQRAHPQERPRSPPALDRRARSTGSHRPPHPLDRPLRQREKGPAGRAHDRREGDAARLRRQCPGLPLPPRRVEARTVSPNCRAASCTASCRPAGRAAASSS